MPDESADVMRVQIAMLIEQIKELNRRLDDMPTNQLFTAHMAGWETRIKNVEDDIGEVKADAKETKNQARQARQWAVGALIAAAGVVVAALGVLQGGVGG